jgi:hypothetical protein
VNDTPDRSFAEVLAQVATQRGSLENVKDDTGESEGPAEPAAPLVDEAVTRHGFNLHASLNIAADDDLGLPDSVASACGRSSARGGQSKPRSAAGERPPPRDRSGPVVPTAVPVSATTLARSIDAADVPMPNVLSVRHLARIGGGLLYAATSNVPWATLLARTFEIDAKSCARCGGRLEVRAVVTDRDIARRILEAIPTVARAPPPVDSTVAYEPAFA